tara:strand:+ start:47 stop:550 length:504 start_codon:yes stop_codon:yes gene_type:complete
VKIINIITVLVYIVLVSCNIYSFSGASISNDVKSFSVDYIKSQTTNSPSSLNQSITDNLQTLILNQTNLSLQEKSIADLNFKGTIIKYEIKPIAITSNETTAKNRLTIKLKLEYVNNKNKDLNYTTTFNRYRDFDSSINFSDVELVLIEEITKELAEDIFNKAFVNW